MPNLNNLSTEILTKIYQNLDAADLRNVVQTSRRMQDIAKPIEQNAWRDKIIKEFSTTAVHLSFCEPAQYARYYAALMLAKKISMLNGQELRCYIDNLNGLPLSSGSFFYDHTEFRVSQEIFVLTRDHTMSISNKQEFNTWINILPVNLKKYYGIIKHLALHSIVDEDGITPLKRVVRAGDVELAQDLIKFKADINAATLGGNTILMEAIGQGYTKKDKDRKIMISLLKAGANVNRQDRNNRSELIHLVLHTGGALALKIFIAKALLCAGADASMRDNEGKNSYDWAMHYQNELSNFLRNAKQFQIEHFCQRLMTGSLEEVKDIIIKQQSAGITKQQICDHIFQKWADNVENKDTLMRVLERDKNGNPTNALTLYIDTYQVAQESGTESSAKKWLVKSISQYKYTPSSFFFRRDTETASIMQQRLNELQGTTQEVERGISPNKMIPLTVFQYQQPGLPNNSSSSSSSAAISMRMTQ